MAQRSSPSRDSESWPAHYRRGEPAAWAEAGPAPAGGGGPAHGNGSGVRHDLPWDRLVERAGALPASPPAGEPRAQERPPATADDGLAGQVAAMQAEIDQLRRKVEALIRWGRQVDVELSQAPRPDRLGPPDAGRRSAGPAGPAGSRRTLAPTDDWQQ